MEWVRGKERLSIVIRVCVRERGESPRGNSLKGTLVIERERERGGGGGAIIMFELCPLLNS